MRTIERGAFERRSASSCGECASNGNGRYSTVAAASGNLTGEVTTTGVNAEPPSEDCADASLSDFTIEDWLNAEIPKKLDAVCTTTKPERDDEREADDRAEEVALMPSNDDRERESATHGEREMWTHHDHAADSGRDRDHSDARPVHEQARHAVRGNAGGEEHERVLADRRRPVDQRRHQHEPLEIGRCRVRRERDAVRAPEEEQPDEAEPAVDREAGQQPATG